MPLLTPPQAALYLNVSRKTLANWRVSGRGPVFIKMGPGLRAPIRYRKADLDAFLSESRRASTSATRPPEVAA